MAGRRRAIELAMGAAAAAAVAFDRELAISGLALGTEFEERLAIAIDDRFDRKAAEASPIVIGIAGATFESVSQL